MGSIPRLEQNASADFSGQAARRAADLGGHLGTVGNKSSTPLQCDILEGTNGFVSGASSVGIDAGWCGGGCVSGSVDLSEVGSTGGGFGSCRSDGVVAGSRSSNASLNFLRRFFLQSAARELLPREAVANCLRRIIPVRAGVDVLYAPVAGAAHYSGLMVCKSVWQCPVCAAKISERRRIELTLGINNFYAENGVKRVLLVTFTLSHHIGDELSVVKAVLKKARASLVSGRGAIAFAAKFGIVGMVRSLEVTYGANGWHPHLHVLYFFDNEIAIIPFEETIKRRWSDCVAAAGGSASYENGCDVRFSDREVANYVSKFGKEPDWLDQGSGRLLPSGKWSVAHEVSKGPSKISKIGGRTPLQLLIDFAYGDMPSGGLWWEYAVNFRGERQLRYSDGLRLRLGLEEKEKSDSDVMDEQDEVAVVLAQLNREQWKVVLGNDCRGELLQVASSGDVLVLNAFLVSIGITI